MHSRVIPLPLSVLEGIPGKWPTTTNDDNGPALPPVLLVMPVGWTDGRTVGSIKPFLMAHEDND